MVLTRFRAERLAEWMEIIAQEHARVWGRSAHAPDFRAEAEVLELGSVRISALTSPAVEMCRTPRLIREDDPKAYLLHLIVTGGGEVEGERRGAELLAGDFVLLDTSRPHRLQRSGDDCDARTLVVRVPHGALPLPRAAAGRITLIPFSSEDGIAAVLAGYLKELHAQAGDYASAHALPLGYATLDLLTAACTSWLDTTRTREPQREALLAQIYDFIERRLADRTLSPAVVAAAHQISTRQLHRVFAAQGQSVAAWIRRRRLERCRRDLADPRLRARPIHAVAARWGFSDGAHFSRLFRATFGMSPSDYRHAASRA